MGSQPTGAPSLTEIDDHWRQFDNSVNAVSFGFVATAVLISMFLVMAIFERFLRPTSPESSPTGRRYIGDVESQMGFHGKLRFPSPKVREPSSGRGLPCLNKPNSSLQSTYLLGHPKGVKGCFLLVRLRRSLPEESGAEKPRRGSALSVWYTCNRVLLSGSVYLSSSNAREVSVLMPGEDIPTFIANPAPVPCPPERIAWPTHQPKANTSSSST
ncbi:hypothetical protein C3L33_06269, partial [Rhododendron williamsianum]